LKEAIVEAIEGEVISNLPKDLSSHRKNVAIIDI
jgi:hypothetical protein